MATGVVGLSNFWMSPLSRPNPKTPYWMQAYGLQAKGLFGLT